MTFYGHIISTRKYHYRREDLKFCIQKFVLQSLQYFYKAVNLKILWYNIHIKFNSNCLVQYIKNLLGEQK